MELYYRYKEMFYTDSRMSLLLYEFPVLKHTKKGVWIEEYTGHKRFVLNESRKRFACSTKEEALESYRARKKRQIRILKAQLKRAECALTLEQDKLTWV